MKTTTFLDTCRSRLLVTVLLWTAVELLIMLILYAVAGTIRFLAPFLFLLSFGFGLLLANIAKTLKALLVSQTLDFVLYSVIFATTFLIPRYSETLTWLDVSVVLAGFTLLAALAYFFFGILGSMAGAWIGSWIEDRKNARDPRKIAPLEPVSGLAGLPLKSVSVAEQTKLDRALEEISKKRNREKNY